MLRSQSGYSTNVVINSLITTPTVNKKLGHWLGNNESVHHKWNSNVTTVLRFQSCYASSADVAVQDRKNNMESLDPEWISIMSNKYWWLQHLSECLA